MDNGSPAARVERTFWTVWSYITEAVNRFFRPEAIGNDPNSIQESAVDSDTANNGHAEGDASRREVNEEQPVATASVLSSSRPAVEWELCTREIDLGPGEESMLYKTQLSTESESRGSDEGEGEREEQFAQTGNDDAKEDRQEEDTIPKSSTHEQDETHEEHVDTILLKLTADAVSEDVEESGRKPGAEEAQETPETERTMAPDDLQKMDVTITKISLMEEDEKAHQEDEHYLKAEDVEVILSTITTLSLDEEGNTHIEEASLQGDEADTAVMHEEVECSVGLLLLAPENKTDEAARQVENQLVVCEELSDDATDFKGDSSFTLQITELEMADNGSAVGSEDALIVVGQEHVMIHRSESDKVEDEEEKEDENTLDKMAQGAITEEENANVDEVPEQEEDNIPVTGKDISNAHVICSEEFVQDVKTELHTVEFKDGEEEDVTKDTEGQSKTRETDDVESESNGEVIDGKSDMTGADVSADERFYDNDQVEKERLSSEVGDMEVACTTTSVTVKPEGETGQEVSGGFQNIPQGICEGRHVVSQALNSPPCEETQEGVPDYNNEPGPDENKTQMFLEVGDREETQNMHLPEEVESKEPESLQNRTEYLGEREHMEEGNTERIDLVVEEHAGILRLSNAGFPQETETPLVEPEVQEPGILFEEEEEKLSVGSMKTAIERSGNDLELHVGVTDEKTTEELQDGTEELLVEIDEGLCDFEGADAFGDGCERAAAAVAKEVVRFGLKSLVPEIQMTAETTLFQESAETVNLQNRDRTSALLEDFTETGFLKQSVETEPNLLDDSTEMQDAGIDMDETCYEVEVEAAEENEMDTLNLHVAGMAGEPNTDRNEKDDTLIAEAEMLEATQLSDEALEISDEETEAADESMMSEFKPDMTVISAEEKAKHEAESGGSHTEESPISQDVIDEEILDLWIETVLSEDTDGIKQQEGPETGQHIDAGTPSSEKQDEVLSVQTEKEQLVETNSEQSEMVCETEMSSSTAESGFLDQSLCELSTQNSDTQLLNTAGSFQGIHDMLADMSESADVSEVSTQEPTSESQDLLMEETEETEQSYLDKEESRVYADSKVTSSEDIHQYQESDKSQETKDEETGSQQDFDAKVTDAEEADVQSLTNKSPLVKIDETKGEEEPLEAAVSDSLDEIEDTDLERSSSGSEASVGEEVVLTGSGPQGDTYSESEEKLLEMPSLDKPQPRWSEAIIDSLPGFNRNEMVEQTMESREQMKDEVQVEVLDFTAQKSRIAVKNPLVRPPKDPRSLLHMPSMDPTPTSHQPVKIPTGVPLGIGIKLPGFGAGFPVLKKTQPAVRDENSQETASKEPESKPEEMSDSPKQDETQHKPKWMPPRHPGFGNPLMSELKNKLKKTPKDD